MSHPYGQARHSRTSRRVATVFGLGHLPLAPGTWTSAAAIPCGMMLLWLGGAGLLAAAVVVVTLAGCWASRNYMRATQREDPSEIVIDEVAGQWLALLPAGLAWPDALVAFVLFRVADIVKVWPANWADRTIHGGIGVMVDDLIAGIYAAIVLGFLIIGGVL